GKLPPVDISASRRAVGNRNCLRFLARKDARRQFACSQGLLGIVSIRSTHAAMIDAVVRKHAVRRETLADRRYGVVESDLGLIRIPGCHLKKNHGGGGKRGHLFENFFVPASNDFDELHVASIPSKLIAN